MNINSLSEDEQLEIIKDEPLMVHYIKNQSLKVQLATVNSDGLCIKYIKNPSYEVQLAAIQDKTNYKKYHFEYIKPYITYPDLLELLELKLLSCTE